MSYNPLQVSFATLSNMRLPSFFLLLGFRLALLKVASAIDAGDIIDTGYAQYLGNRTFSNAVAYLGIPYAEPPLGERRF